MRVHVTIVGQERIILTVKSNRYSTAVVPRCHKKYIVFSLPYNSPSPSPKTSRFVLTWRKKGCRATVSNYWWRQALKWASIITTIPLHHLLLATLHPTADIRPKSAASLTSSSTDCSLWSSAELFGLCARVRVFPLFVGLFVRLFVCSAEVGRSFHVIVISGPGMID